MDSDNSLPSEKPLPTHKSFFWKNSPKYVIYFSVLIGFILTGLAGFYLGGTEQEECDILAEPTVFAPNVPSPTIEPALTTSTMTPISCIYLSGDVKVYENLKYKYRFDYPKGIVEVYDCPDASCVLIRDYTLKIDALRFDDERSLKEEDLFCAADGPGGSIYCINKEIIPYKNSYGKEGFKITRTKVHETYGENYPNNSTKKEFEDWVYVFPIKDNDYKSVLFSVEDPSSANLKQLDVIADTFRLVEN